VAALRRLEPTGLLKLAAAQVHIEDWSAAERTLNALRKTEWPSRFNTVTDEIRALEAKLPPREQGK
jgi:hypothetical protein